MKAIISISLFLFLCTACDKATFDNLETGELSAVESQDTIEIVHDDEMVDETNQDNSAAIDPESEVRDPAADKEDGDDDKDCDDKKDRDKDKYTEDEDPSAEVCVIKERSRSFDRVIKVHFYLGRRVYEMTEISISRSKTKSVAICPDGVHIEKEKNLEIDVEKKFFGNYFFAEKDFSLDRNVKKTYDSEDGYSKDKSVGVVSQVVLEKYEKLGRTCGFTPFGKRKIWVCHFPSEDNSKRIPLCLPIAALNAHIEHSVLEDPDSSTFLGYCDSRTPAQD